MLTSGTARKRRAVRILFSAVALGCSYFSQDAFAADGTWSATSGGTWGTASNWLNSIAPSSASDVAVFSTVSAAQTIFVGGNNTIKAIQFNSVASGGLTLSPVASGDGINLSAGGTGSVTLLVDGGSGDHISNLQIRLQGSGTHHGWEIGSNRTFISNGTLTGTTGTRGIAKSGDGTLVLAGLSTGSFNGDLAISAGTVVLDYRSNSSNKLNAGLTLGGGSLSLLGSSSTAVTQVVSGMTIASGQSFVSVAAGLNNGITLSVGAITRATAGGVVSFSKTNNGGLGVVTISTINSNNTSVLGGYALYGLNNWATGGAIGAFSNYNPVDDTGSWGAGQNISDTAAFTGTTNSVAINTLRFNAAAASTATVAAGNTLTISTGGLLVTPNVGANNSKITGGSITSGNGFDLIVHQNNASGTLTIESVIAGAGVGLTKSGNGTLVLTPANTFTGATYIHSGSVVIKDAAALGTGTVFLKRGSLVLSDVSLTANNLVLSNGASLRTSGVSSYSKTNFPSIAAAASVEFAAPLATDTLTIGTTIRDGSGATITVSGDGTVAISQGATTSSPYSGTWLVNMGSTGVLRLSNENALGGGTTPGTAIVTGGALVSSTGNPIPNAITLAGGALGATGATSRSFSGALTLKPSTTSTLSLVDPSNGTTARSLNITGPIGGSGNLSITGSGNATFTANSNYTGTTTIAGGTLSLVHASSTNNIASSPSITIQSGANLDVSGIASGFALGTNQTLKGSGTVHGNFSANPSSASRIAPGNSGKLTFNGDLTLNPNATYDIQIGGDGVGIGLAGTDFDQIVVNGAGKSLTLGTASLKILPMPGIVVGQAYRIVNTTNGAGVVNSSIFKNLTQNLNAGGPYTEGNVTYDIAYGYGSGGYVDITFSAVPEPTSMLLTTLCGALFMRRRRSR